MDMPAVEFLKLYKDNQLLVTWRLTKKVSAARRLCKLVKS
jgi:hypothetical protein